MKTIQAVLARSVRGEAAWTRRQLPALLWVAWLGITLASCMKEVVNPKLPKSGVRLSLQCYLSPDDTVSRAYLYLTRPLIGKIVDGTADYPSGGRVLVTDGADTAWFERRSLAKDPNFPNAQDPHIFVLQRKNFALVPGKTYKVVAMDTTGRQAWGSCTIPPDEPPAFRTEFEITPNGPDSSYLNIQARMRWPNLPGNNHYRVLGEEVSYVQVIPGEPNSGGVRVFPWYVQGENYESSFLKEESFGTDSLFVTLVGGVSQYGTIDSSFVQLHLLQTDKPYYDFHISLGRYWNSDFFTEPIQVYTNVENGVGVVAAYRMRTERRRVR